MALWTPAAITTALWLDASDSSTLYDATTGGSLVAADGSVARWEDKSGNARHATQGTNLRKPIRKVAVQNGLDCVRLDGDDVLVGNFPSVSQLLIIAVSSSTSWAAVNVLVGLDKYDIAQVTGNFQLSDSAVKTICSYNRNDFGLSTQRITSALFQVSSGDVSGVLGLDGTEKATATVSQASTRQNMLVGAFSSSGLYGWNGDIAEIVAIPTDASTGTRQIIEGYLAWKWGLEANLPADHPYKSAAPTISPYAVNGKEPIAAWIPSLDTAGNGTTTLTDLVGSNNGTLTNMDAATDWVSDTSNGGVRALDFDGSDDYVSLPIVTSASNGSISAWFNTSALPHSASNDSCVFSVSHLTQNTITRIQVGESTGFYADESLEFIVQNNGSVLLRMQVRRGHSFFKDGNWHNVVVRINGIANTIYVDGVDQSPYITFQIGSATTNAFLNVSANFSAIGIDSWNNFGFRDQFDGLIDDIRIFDTALDASDIAYLYNNGNGRGRTPSIYAVNGKDPIAAWIPSRDTAGNGTTTLTDLVGSNDGTLTNMDAATDWVSDTDAGGIRALDFDGVDDYVAISSNPADITNVSSDFTYSCWIYMRNWDGSNFVFSILATGTQDYKAASFQVYLRKLTFIADNNGIAYWDIGASTPIGNTALNLSEWYHVGLARQSGVYTAYINGTPDGSVTYNSNLLLSNTSMKIGGHYSANTLNMANGLIDDIRIFDQALDATDIAYLYNSGNGRGIIVESPSIPSAIYHPFASLKHPLTF